MTKLKMHYEPNMEKCPIMKWDRVWFDSTKNKKAVTCKHCLKLLRKP